MGGGGRGKGRGGGERWGGILEVVVVDGGSQGSVAEARREGPLAFPLSLTPLGLRGSSTIDGCTSLLRSPRTCQSTMFRQ